MDSLQFTIPEILSLIGMTQCVYILVYIAFRAGRLSRAGLPILYFFILGAAFFFDAADNHLAEVTPWYDVMQWFFWFSGPPASVLLLIQIAQITQVPPLRHFWVLGLMPLALALSLALGGHTGCEVLRHCPELRDWLIVTGLLAGGVSLLTIWFKRDIFAEVLQQKTGRERYWLILALIITNVLFLATMLGLLGPLDSGEALLIRTVLGLGLVYLANTSLFRIYPRAVQIEDRRGQGALSEADLVLAKRIEQLIEMDKIYHEAAYSRSDLARELGQPETTVSRIINQHFGKSFPQLVNERRVEDAKRLLAETKVSVKTVASEVGFNSLASFNRVFKDLAGETPSHYRKTRSK